MSNLPSRSAFALTVFFAFALLAQRPAQATQLPAIHEILPDVGAGNPTAALRVSIEGVARTLDISDSPPFVTVPIINSVNDQRTDLRTTFHTQTTLGRGLSASSDFADVTSVMDGVAGFGRLRAVASVSYAPGSRRGTFSSGSARVVVEFLDAIQFIDTQANINHGYTMDWNVDGSVNGVPNVGTSNAKAETWLFPFGPLPQPNRFIEGTAYGSFQEFSGSPPSVTNIGFDNIALGGTYWLYSRLEVNAGFNILGPERFNLDGTISADFSHTAILSITPNFDSPEPTFTTASGFNYARPVPLPSSLSMALVGGVGIVCWRRRMTPDPDATTG